MKIRLDQFAPYEVEESDVTFAKLAGQDVLARVYRPKGTPDAPLAALVDRHGGAWSRGDRNVGVHLGRGLAACALSGRVARFSPGPGSQAFGGRAGFDGVCTNEHHQNAYGFMPSPNLMGSVLAKATNDLPVAIVQMGTTLPTQNPPIRVAGEYAMLDCISGGRPKRAGSWPGMFATIGPQPCKALGAN